jgi:hypothetical protein
MAEAYRWRVGDFSAVSWRAGRKPGREGFIRRLGTGRLGKGARMIEALRLWCWGAIPGCVMGRVTNRQSSEGSRSERPELPQAGRSEPGEVGREGRPASGLNRPHGARGKGRETAKTGDLWRNRFISRVLRVCLLFLAVFSEIGLKDSSVRSAMVIENEP